MTIDSPPSAASGTPTTPAGNDVPAQLRRAIELAASLQKRAIELQTPAERRQQADLDRMLQSPTDKSTLTQMTDQAFRTNDPARAVEHLTPCPPQSH